MNNPRFQHLSEAFNSIIFMMLAMLRARGLRGLFDLPNMIMAAIYLRRLGKEFAAIIASLDLSALPPRAPALPEPQPAPPQPESAQSRAKRRTITFGTSPGSTRRKQASKILHHGDAETRRSRIRACYSSPRLCVSGAALLALSPVVKNLPSFFWSHHLAREPPSPRLPVTARTP